MKRLLIICSLILLTVFITSCENESLEDLTVGLQKDFEKSVISKLGAEEGALWLENMYHPSKNSAFGRSAITYDGELCPGEVNSGTVELGGYDFFTAGDFWYFSGDAGDVVDIIVDRTNCEMDPILVLYSGFGDTDLLTQITFADDNNGPACPANCPSFGDPSLDAFVLPESGVYTLAVWDFFSGVCAVGSMTYNVVVTGQNNCTIVVDGCDTGVDDQDLAVGTMQDAIDTLVAGIYRNHGQFVRSVAKVVAGWFDAGLITFEEKKAIMACVGMANIPS